MNHLKPAAKELGNWDEAIARFRLAWEDRVISSVEADDILDALTLGRAQARMALNAKRLGRAIEDLSLSPKHTGRLLAQLTADAAFAGV